MGENPSLVRLTIPARKEHALIARIAMSGVGLIEGLDVDTIGDLRTVTGECVDCLINQPMRPSRVELAAWAEDKRLYCRFDALERSPEGGVEAADMDVTRGVLETLMPEVLIESDEGGVKSILCSMPL